METWLNAAWDFIAQTLLAELIVVIVGVLIVQKAQNWLDKKRYGGWRVIVLKEGKTIVKRDVSYKKLKDIQEEPADLSVYLKGIISPYTWAGVDIIEHGEKKGLVRIDHEKKIYFIDLDKNEKPAPQTMDEITERFAGDVMKIIAKEKN